MAGSGYLASSCLAGESSTYHRTPASGDDVVIVAAYRTAHCKSKRGGFKDTLPDDLLSTVLKAVIEKTNVNPREVGDIVVGTVLAPDTVPIRTVNRQCSSGLQAVADVAAYIKAGFYDIGIGAGVESMSIDSIGPISKVNPKVESHKRAAIATSSGKFRDEIVPIVDPKTGEEKPVTISVDDGIRPNTNMADLAKLKPAFKKDGTSSQVTDGAAAVLLMKRSLALKKGLPILGPAVAIPIAVKSAGLELDNIDLFEINEEPWLLGIHWDLQDTNPRKLNLSAYDIIELKTNGIGRSAESKNEKLIDGVSDNGIDLLLLLQGSQ
ncbi:Thiolase [Cynara cardunculus var. scolymus]|uniref:Thiolase n=1 Tax=Cynara cardunculus var. scolymus TaxID=59895 RepID=A0A103Y7A3_CYNCS|nr:Thiolase [Cynara cardunculus var. scolymus]